MLTDEIFQTIKQGKQEKELVLQFTDLPKWRIKCYYLAYEIWQGNCNQKKQKHLLNLISNQKQGDTVSSIVDKINISRSTYNYYNAALKIVEDYYKYLYPDSDLDLENILKLRWRTKKTSTRKEPINPPKDNSFVNQCLSDSKIECQKISEEYQSLFNAFDLIINTVASIKTYYTLIGNYNIEMQKLLHNMENCKDETELLEISKALYQLRLNRRATKNRYILASKLLSELKAYKIHTNQLNEIKLDLETVLKNIENPSYNPPKLKEIQPPAIETEPKKNSTVYVSEESNDTTENLDDWQKKIQSIVT